MSFVKLCVNDSMSIWEKCLDTNFLRGVSDGSLSEAAFKGYIVDDSLYLREYARVFAWGILYAKDMEEIRAYYSFLSFVNESEDSTRRYYLKRYGLSDEEIQFLPLRRENQAYVNDMHCAAKNSEGAAECMMAALPCMLSYGWIFGEMIRRSPSVLNTVYGRFVSDYAGKRYEELCGYWMEFSDKACSSLSDKRKKRCMEIFRVCSLHELHFWEMSALPRKDV